MRRAGSGRVVALKVFLVALGFGAPAHAEPVPAEPPPRPLAPEAESAAAQRAEPSAPSKQTAATASPAPVDLGTSAAVQSFLSESFQSDCDAAHPFVSGERVFVACGLRGALVLAKTGSTLTLLDRLTLPGRVIGFFELEGRVWARVVEERAQVVHQAQQGGAVPPTLAPAPQLPSAQPPSGKPPSAQPPSTAGVSPQASATPAADLVGTVTAVDGLVIDVKVQSQAWFADPPARLVFPQPGRTEDASVVGRITAVEGDVVKVQLGVNEHVPLGTSARGSDEPVTASRIAPPRVIDVWEARAMLRPLMNLGSFGGGVLAELGAGRRSRHFHYGVTLAPLGFGGSSEDDAVSTWQAYAHAAFDSLLFSAGLGLGAQAVNDTGFQAPAGSGLTLVQLLRIGALDGLHLSSRTTAVVFHSETEFSGLEMQGQISVARDAWLIFRGGGGTQGFGFGEVALRNLMQGNGRRGSWFLEVSAGGAGLFEQTCPTESVVLIDDGCQETFIGGPLIGLGAEWRL